MRFSQRIGKRPIKTILQVEAIDNDLKNRLWNNILEDFFNKLIDVASFGEDSQKGQICRLIWKEFYKKPIDEIPTYSNVREVYVPGVIEFLRRWFYEAEWFDIYDFIEFISIIDTRIPNTGFTNECNHSLQKEVAGYRIVNERIVQITSEEEIQEIEAAIIGTDNWQSVNTHLRTSLDLLADRKNPDYRNSIKESISGVESLCKIITRDDNASLGKALNEIEKTHKIHNALKTAFSSIYGYTSDSGGIRHALIEADVTVEFEDAKFMLVSCSAFINYLKAKLKK
jgi:hypothetical protein